MHVVLVFELMKYLDRTGTIGHKPGNGKRHCTHTAENTALSKEMALSVENARKIL